MEVIPYSIPMRTSFTTAHGNILVRQGAIVVAQTADGLQGFGDIAPLPEFAHGTLADALTLFPKLATPIKTLPLDQALTFLWEQTDHYPSSLIYGIELALLDLAAKIQQRPLHHLLSQYSYQFALGGQGRRDWACPCPQSLRTNACEIDTEERNLVSASQEPSSAPNRVRVNAVIGAPALDVAVEQAQRALAQGFRCLKLKVGNNKQTVIERVAAIRQAIGPEIHLRLDANEGWDITQATTILRACEPFAIQYVEQPLPRHDLAGMARLCTLVPVAIAADEAVSDLASARLLMQAHAADILIVKPQFARGLRMSQQIIAEATDRGLQCVLTSAIESGIGVAGVLHLAAAMPRGQGKLSPYLESGLATLSLLEHDLLVDTLLLEQGWMHLPVAPGLGVQLDPSILEKYILKDK
jgi:o-succinylbenzoate synthase